MISMTVVWVIVVALLHIYIGRVGRVVMMSLAGAVIVFAVLLMSGKLGLNEDYNLYASQLAGGSLAKRVESSGISNVFETFRQSGFWGKGIGTAAQGIQYLGLPIQRSWQEAGSSKLMVELGVLGFCAALLLAWSIYRATMLTIKYSRSTGILSPLQLGLAGFVAANIANFLISGQVFSDGLIMVMIALALAMLLSSPLWLQEKQA